MNKYIFRRATYYRLFMTYVIFMTCVIRDLRSDIKREREHDDAFVIYSKNSHARISCACPKVKQNHDARNGRGFILRVSMSIVGS